jgi:type VI secretion system secreted protein Hcp
MFLKLDGIKGESIDDASPSHKDEIEILGWSFGGTNPASYAMGQGGQQSKPTFSEFHVVKTADSSSVTLMRAMSGGQHIKSGKITCRKAIKDSDKLEYLIVDLTDVSITSIQFNGSGAEQHLNETMSLQAAQFKVTYKLQADAGAAGGGNDMTYNLQTQKVS